MFTEIQAIVPGILHHLFLKQSVPEEPENLNKIFIIPNKRKGIEDILGTDTFVIFSDPQEISRQTVYGRNENTPSLYNRATVKINNEINLYSSA